MLLLAWADALIPKPPFRLILPALAGALLLLFAAPNVSVPAFAASLGLLWLYRRDLDYDPGAPEKRLIFVAAFYLLIWLIAAAVHGGFVPGDFAGYAALLLVYPVHRVSRCFELDERAVWWALGGASAAGAIAMAVSLAMSGPVAEPAWWGNLGFVMGAMMLGSLSYAAARAARCFLLLLATLGMMAGFASGFWGPWLALPVVLSVWFLHAPDRLRRRFRWAVVLAILIGIEIVLLVDDTGALARFRRLALQANVWSYSGGADGLLGAVLQDWQMALAAFAAHPAIGAGHDVSTSALNQYVLTLDASGVVGALALGLLIGIPGRLFGRMARHTDAAVQRLGLAGLLLVTAYGVIGLIQPVFSDGRTLAFYALVVAALYAAARQMRAVARARPVVRKQTLSVTIIARDEADRIGRCLDSIAGWADEIIVLDSGSRDDTVAIARRYTEHVGITDWPGYGAQKQRALERATCDWVLSLDADEALTPELKHDIDEALNDAPECTAYALPWAVVVFGKRLDFGRPSRAPLRLTQREGARFSPDIVHEKIQPPPGRVGRLEGRLLHYSWRDFGHALNKSADYAWLGARRRHARGRRGGGVALAAVRSLWMFVQLYFLRLGLLDGRVGFIVAVIEMQESFNRYAGLWTLRRNRST
ncbi:MAG TPA: glycosyltransferase family 2 protein [Gammaproteobacteria bacterium]|nr:glycosyltransferase family 2 protein [Gammaproteobacteria bacterium]